MSSFPDYYAVLSVSKAATTEEIRQAYKKESLRTHPDRLVNATLAERQRATEKFQMVADAYFVLSDLERRKEYDHLYVTRSDRTQDPGASTNFFANLASMFMGKAPPPSPTTGPEPTAGAERPDADGVFADVFEELLRPEVEKHAPWWTYLGAACGAGLGFIVGNLPGMMVGAYAGNRLGAIRDAKGKAVAAVFAELGGTQKAEIIKALALKILGTSGVI